jgi:hypothetical protein
MHGKGRLYPGIVLKSEQIWGGKRVEEEYILKVVFGDKVPYLCLSYLV